MDSSRSNNTRFCGPQLLTDFPSTIEMPNVEGEYGLTNIYCSWVLIKQKLDKEFEHELQKFVNKISKTYKISFQMATICI